MGSVTLASQGAYKTLTSESQYKVLAYKVGPWRRTPGLLGNLNDYMAATLPKILRLVR